MNKIKLTQNQHALVDDDDFAELDKYKWYACWNKVMKSFYAMRKIPIGNNKRVTVSMHRVIMCPPEKLVVDHIDHNTLDNRKSNLRICTQSQNLINRRTFKKNNTTNVLGVCWHKNNKKWVAYIGINKKRIYLGCFNNTEEANIARKDAVKKYHGEFAFNKDNY